MKERQKIIAYFLALGIFPLIFLVLFITDKDDYDNKFGKFKTVGKETILNSKIIDIIKNRGAFYIFEDSTYYTFPWGINLNHNPTDLSYFLEKGDLLIKNKNSDTLFIFRNNKKYYFRFKHKILKDSVR